MNAFEKHTLNDLQGLSWVHRFGWLRTLELGKLLWPGTAAESATRQANRLAKSWAKRGLVLERELPDGAGRALVLATAGVTLLAAHDVKATTGKDIGKLITGKWYPPKTWRHDLLAAGLLVELHRQGWTVFPEREIRQGGWLVKIPDGIAVAGKEVLSLEVERAHKTGAEGRKLTDALCAVGAGEAGEVLGHKPTIALVAYNPAARDSRGCALDHRGRIRSAVAAATKKPVFVIWAACELRGTAGLGDVKFERETIEPDLVAGVLKFLQWRPHPEKTGVFVANYSEHFAAVWEDEYGNGWRAEVDDMPAGYYAENISAAKYECAAHIAALL